VKSIPKSSAVLSFMKMAIVVLGIASKKFIKAGILDIALLRNQPQEKKSRSNIIKETLIKSFDKLRTNGNWLILSVASVSNHARNQLVRSFLKVIRSYALTGHVNYGH
jgi:hypothetical protein